ncbi:MAG: exodeoxyribonuclease VII small subunit [Phycisphaerae bacterium]|nr:exodeoxyribonuclease VII small subunit [Phycisphaerae bacterium]
MRATDGAHGSERTPRARAAAPPSASETGESVSALTYEVAIAELEAIIARIESGEIPLEESLQQYRRGAALVRRCRDVLDAAKTEVERISASDLAKGDSPR